MSHTTRRNLAHLATYLPFLATTVIGIVVVLLLMKLAVLLRCVVAPQVHGPLTTAILLDLIQIFALLATGSFFAYKLFTGWLIINLSLSIDTTRQAQPTGNDLLVVTIGLDKGTTDTLWLTSMSCRLKQLKSPAIGRQVASAEPVTAAVWDFDAQKRYATVAGRVDWEKPAGGLTLSPGEKTSFAKLFFVLPGFAYEVEVTVLGDRPLWWPGSSGQWRIVAIALPVPSKATA